MNIIPFITPEGFTEVARMGVARRFARMQDSKAGGYFTAVDGRTGRPWFTAKIVAETGVLPAEKAPKYMGFSLEKACRLASHPDHDLSSQSRNIEVEQYGGAIRVGRWILSFSGLPEAADEALMLWVAVKMGIITVGEAYAIAEKSPIAKEDELKEMTAIFQEDKVAQAA